MNTLFNKLIRLNSLLEKHRVKVVIITTLAVVIFVAFVVSLSINVQPIASDDALNLQAPVNIVRNGAYASFGAIWEGSDKVFDPYLSTGPIISLPIALAFKLFGVSVLPARIVMLVLYAGFICLATWFVYHNTKSAWASLMPLAILLTVDKQINYPIAALGEFTAIGLVFGSMLAWQKRKFLLAGLLAGGAVLSKFLMLLLIIAGLFYLGVQLVRHWKNKVRVIKNGLLYMVGLGLSLGLWEVFRFIQLGSSLHAYKYNLKEFVDYFKVNGSGLAENGTKITIPTKFSMVLANVSLITPLLIIAAGCLLWLGWQNRALINRRLEQNMYGLLFIGLYVFWWFFKSNGAYSRYVMPLAVISLGIILSLALATKKDGVQWPAALVKLLLLIIVLVGIWQNYFPIRRPTFLFTLQDQQAAARRVEDYRPTNLAHAGWWQNPDTLLFTGLRSRVAHSLVVGEKYQLLLSPPMKEIVPADYIRAKNTCHDIIFEQKGYVLCNSQVVKGQPVE